MSKAKHYSLRAIRKATHVGNKSLRKTLHFTTRVENKATRLIDGTDFNSKVDHVVPLEKIYYNSLQYITPLNPALPKVGQRASVVLLIPSLDNGSFFGGTATALVVAAKLALALKQPLRIVQTIKTAKTPDVSGFLRTEGVTMPAADIDVSSVADRAYNFYGYLPMHKDDTYIASAWWDAHLISQLPLTKKFIYLIQDFEPIFYNNSDLYVLAESTYKLDSFIPLCNTELMYDFMRDRHYPALQKEENSFYFEPAVSRMKSGATPDRPEDAKKCLFLYGRPNVHRNLFFTALNAIDYSFKAGFLDKDEWELYMAGQDRLPDIKLSSGPVIKNKGKMEMQDYVAFSKTVDLAVSPMMAPHPNYPTLEFASIGAAVVTTKYANKVDLSAYSPNIFMSDIDAESMAGAINLAAKLDYKTRSKNLQQTHIQDSWDASLDKQLEHLLKMV